MSIIYKYQKLLTILVQENVISEDQLEEALEVQKNIKTGRKKKIGEILMDLNYADYSDIIFALKLQMGFPRTLKDELLSADEELVHLIPKSFARENKTVIFEEDNGTLKVAMNDPDDEQVIQKLQEITEKDVEPTVATRQEIYAVIDHFYE